MYYQSCDSPEWSCLIARAVLQLLSRLPSPPTGNWEPSRSGNAACWTFQFHSDSRGGRWQWCDMWAPEIWHHIRGILELDYSKCFCPCQKSQELFTNPILPLIKFMMSEENWFQPVVKWLLAEEQNNSFRQTIERLKGESIQASSSGQVGLGHFDWKLQLHPIC